MKHKLDDGRELMAAYADLHDFFEQHHIVGRTITDIRPAALDYMIRNLDEIDYVTNKWTDSAINTDGQVCIVFADGDHIEVEFSGDGPVILGFNTADFNNYPKYDGSCYTLHTLFQFCIGYQIVNVVFEKSGHKMMFPAYLGINMSEDDEGIKEIRFCLRGGTTLIASGSIDSFSFEHCMDFGGHVRVKYKELFTELNNETMVEIFGGAKETEEVELESFSSISIDESETDEVFGNFGFKDKKGNVVIEPQYLSCGEFHCGLCPVAIGRTWYHTSTGGRYYEMHWGYIDGFGKVVIPFQYREAWGFNKYGVAVVADEYSDYYYMIDVKGNTIVNSACLYVSHYYDYDDRFIEFSNINIEVDHNVGLYDTKKREIMYPPVASSFILWNEDEILVNETGKMGPSDFHQHYINSQGEELYPWLVGRGYAIVEKPNEFGFSVIANAEFTELTGRPSSYFLINGKKYNREWRFGVAGNDGHLAIPAIYDSIEDLANGTFECVKNETYEIICPKSSEQKN